MIDEMDAENARLESFLQDTQVAMKKLETEAIQTEAEEEEVFLQTRTISLGEVRKNVASVGSTFERGDHQL